MVTLNKCYECSTEYKISEVGHGMYKREIQVPKCDCEEKRQAFNEKIYRRTRLKEELRFSGIPKRQKLKTLKNINCEHIEVAKKFVNEFKGFKSRGLFMIGNAGNGKRTLACCIAKALIAKRKRVLFISFADCLNKMQETSSFENSNTVDDLIKKWLMYDLLILDDFGREKYTDKRLENTFLFFNRLYNNCNTIIVTANPENISNLKSIPSFIAILDRLAEQTKVLNFKNKSFRRSNQD